MYYHKVLLLIISLNITGCSSVFNKHFFTGGNNNAGNTSTDYLFNKCSINPSIVSLKDVKTCSNRIAAKYNQYLVLISEEDTKFDMSLLGLTAAGASAIYAGAHKDTLFGIGALAGLVGATKTYADINKTSSTLIAGIESLSCVNLNATLLESEKTNHLHLASISFPTHNYRNAKLELEHLQKQTSQDAKLIKKLEASLSASNVSKELMKNAIKEYDASKAEGFNTLIRIQKNVITQIILGKPDLDSITSSFTTIIQNRSNIEIGVKDIEAGTGMPLPVGASSKKIPQNLLQGMVFNIAPPQKKASAKDLIDLLDKETKDFTKKSANILDLTTDLKECGIKTATK